MMKKYVAGKSSVIALLIMAVIAFCCITAENGFAASGNANKNEYGAYVFNGHSYYLFTNSKMGWLDAKDYCKHLGGHLVTLTSEAENTFVYGTLVQPSGEHAMIGLSDENTEDAWAWVTGEAYSYNNWSSGEPNNQGNEDYVLIRYSDGTWNDGHLERESWSFVCEWDNEKGNPGSGFVLGTDNNSFIHTSNSSYKTAGFVNVKNYKINDTYFNNLKKGLGKDEVIHLRERMKDSWGGSCYGIAATMALVNNGNLTTSDISGKSSSYFGMELPYKNSMLLDNINYCYLGQFVMNHDTGGGTVLASYHQLNGFFQSMAILHGSSIEEYTPSRFFEKLVNAAKSAAETGKVLMFSFNNHCILITDYWYNENKKEHRITLYDENTVGDSESDKQGRFTEMILSQNCNKASFEVEGHKHSFSDLSSQIYSSISNMNLIDPSMTPYYGKTAGSRAMKLNSSDSALIEYPEGYEFTITNKEGKYLNIHEYEEDDGDMQILDINTIVMGGRNIVQLTVPASSWFCVTNATGLNYDAACNWSLEDENVHMIGDFDKKVNINIISGGKYMSLDSSYIDKAYFYAEDNNIKIVPATDETFEFESVVQVANEGDEDIAMTLKGTSSSEVTVSAKENVSVTGTDVNLSSIEGETNGNSIQNAAGMVNVNAAENSNDSNESEDGTINGTAAMFTDKYVYTGRVITPRPTVFDSRPPYEDLEKGKDYELVYPAGDDRKSIGKHGVTIHFIGEYSNSKDEYLTYKIVPGKAKIKKIKAGKKKAVVKIKKLAGGVSYRIGYRANGSKKWKYKTTKKPSNTLKKLKSKKKYQIKVQAFKKVKGTKYYGEWSKIKKTKIK